MEKSKPTTSYSLIHLYYFKMGQQLTDFLTRVINHLRSVGWSKWLFHGFSTSTNTVTGCRTRGWPSSYSGQSSFPGSGYFGNIILRWAMELYNWLAPYTWVVMGHWPTKITSQLASIWYPIILLVVVGYIRPISIILLALKTQYIYIYIKLYI